MNGSTQNTNVYGAYTLDGKFHYKFVEKQLAIATVKFFERLRKIYKKIVFVLDRARWHTAKHVMNYVDQFDGDIRLVFFPKQPSPVSKVLSLDDLKRTRDRALDLSQMKF